VGATVARGRSSLAAISVTAIALAAGLAAGGMVASYDPPRSQTHALRRVVGRRGGSILRARAP
jgi:hypothetical protein